MQAKHLKGGIDLSASTRTRTQELAERLERYRKSYYEGVPEVTDASYDALEDELRTIDPTHPALAKIGSPVVVSEWDKARHEIPMGSLNKVVSEEELRSWARRCDELLANETKGNLADDLFVAEKLDGISIEVIYRDGVLAEAITRGDGEVGERITKNVARMRGVPPRIRDRRSLSVRGEIILRLSDMKAHFPEAASPRNTAAGAAKRFDGIGSEHLTVLFYDVADHIDLASVHHIFEWLRGLGFATPRSAHGTIDDVVDIYNHYGEELRGSLDYEIDGLVVYVNSLRAQALLGEVNRRPRGAVAFKFASKAKVSEVVEIRWDTGPSGRVTPVAIVRPIELAGATVQRASLHNASNVRSLGIGVGDEVLVSRRNNVIPYVEEVVTKRGTANEPPEICSVCAAPLKAEGEYLLCRNENCSAIVEGRIHNWIAAVGALEWGDRLIEQLVEAKLVREPRDLYRLTKSDIANLDRRGDKIAEKCLNQLTRRLPLTLPVFLTALGIENFALQTARLLVSAGYTTIESVLNAEQEALAKVAGLGPIKAASIVRGINQRKDEIQRLLEQGIVPVPQEQEGPLAGCSFAFTGAQSRPRAELTTLVEKNGGRVLSSVTKDLNYLVIDDPTSTSTRAEKARKYGTRLITEAELIAMTAGPSVGS